MPTKDDADRRQGPDGPVEPSELLIEVLIADALIEVLIEDVLVTMVESARAGEMFRLLAEDIATRTKEGWESRTRAHASKGEEVQR